MPEHNFVVHMNGDTAKTLTNNFMSIHEEAGEARQALVHAAPNMRNYYPLVNGEELFAADLATYVEYAKKLEEIQKWAMAGACRAAGVE